MYRDQPHSEGDGTYADFCQSEVQDISESTSVADALSPEAPPVLQARPGTDTAPVAFPFSTSTARIRTRDLLTRLPPKEEAWTLVESYYRYCAWQ